METQQTALGDLTNAEMVERLIAFMAPTEGEYIGRSLHEACRALGWPYTTVRDRLRACREYERVRATQFGYATEAVAS